MSFEAFEGSLAEVGVIASMVTTEEQDSDYESGLAKIGDELWHIRTARTTPTKPGAYVAFWTRISGGVTVPFSADNAHTGLLVFIQQQGRRGVFRFAASHLAELGVTSERGSGKLGFRVYPSWCTQQNATATITQRAQAPAFREF